MDWFLGFIFVLGIAGIVVPHIMFAVKDMPRSCKNTAFKEYKAQIEQSLKDEEQAFIKFLDGAKLDEERAAFAKFKAGRE